MCAIVMCVRVSECARVRVRVRVEHAFFFAVRVCMCVVVGKCVDRENISCVCCVCVFVVRNKQTKKYIKTLSLMRTHPNSSYTNTQYLSSHTIMHVCRLYIQKHNHTRGLHTHTKSHIRKTTRLFALHCPHSTLNLP